MELEVQLLRFNLLPSYGMDAVYWSRFAGMPTLQDLQAQGLEADRVHRHVSKRILDELDLIDKQVVDPSLPVLSLALLQGDGLQRLCRQLGALLCEPALKAQIRGDQVRQLHAHPGHEVLLKARAWAGSPPPVFAPAHAWGVGEILGQFETLGRAAWLRICAAGGKAVELRAALKLPPIESIPDLPSTDALLDLGLELLPERGLP